MSLQFIKRAIKKRRDLIKHRERKAVIVAGGGRPQDIRLEHRIRKQTTVKQTSGNQETAVEREPLAHARDRREVEVAPVASTSCVLRRVDGDDEAEMLAFAAEIEEMLERSSGPNDSVDDGSDEKARGDDAPNRGVREARVALDNMRKLWRRMRRALPQMQVLSGPDMRKDVLAGHLMGVLGIGLAPLPEWGCPEGVDEYMGRLKIYVDNLARARRCVPAELGFPLGNGSWDEELVYSLVIAESPEPVHHRTRKTPLQPRPRPRLCAKLKIRHPIQTHA